MRAIDWKRVWEEMDDWIASPARYHECKTCQHREYKDDWPDQQKIIQKLVEKQLSRRKR